MSAPEFSRPIDRRHPKEKPVEIAADEAERKALAKRFGLVAIHRLEAKADLQADGEAVNVEGQFEADIVQTCAVSGEDLPVSIAEPLSLRFVPEREIAEEEIELEEDELDEIPFSGHLIDLGEAVAQSLALAIDPYATGPEAERVRKEKGLADEEASGPFAALAALKKD
ncbi:DUF177 domain-containing protein [Altererythrobacter soli]|uniref:DUF177 domain-containing protein n=1 Tax=Croceibacterium soli TaxID=1739690 RepID=A0A6I4UT71_9SPHN|nr:DUF177 domain-containing protein [Croceibacterium soli]MXP42102.1 DUF177 domain-containing protein [Croceibacterium soli]